MLEDAREGVAVGGVAAARGHQRPRGVRGDKFDQDAFGGLCLLGPEAVAGGDDIRERTPVPDVRQEQVEEARPRHLRALQQRAELALKLVGKQLGDLRGALAQRGGE